MTKEAVFLDRDGVLNDNSRLVNQPDDLVLYPWVIPALRRLKEAGYMTFVVTNQGGVELGHLTPATLDGIHNRLEELTASGGTNFDEIVYCPHYYQECECRKPKPGMILSISNRYGIYLPHSWMVGDREADIMAGKAAGCRTIKLGRPYPGADFSCRRLDEAVMYILALPKK